MRYYFNNSRNYIDTREKLSAEQLDQLKEIMSFFPYKDKENWPEQFRSFQPEKYSSKLVYLAANAFDHNGYTMLGLACEYGKDIEVVQKLIDLGAHLDTADHHMKKTPLHRAIDNQLSASNRDSLSAAAVVQCLLQNRVNTQNTSFQKPILYARAQHFEAAEKLIGQHKHYCREFEKFRSLLLSGNTHALKKMVEGSVTLPFSMTQFKGWSLVFNAIQESYTHQNTLSNLELLKKHHVDFNSTFYLKTYLGVPVYCSVNPIAYLLLRGGDSRLIDALMKHGADPDHPSVAVVKKIIEQTPQHRAFDYPVQNNKNPYDVNSRKMLALFESKMRNHNQESSHTKKSDANPSRKLGFFERSADLTEDISPDEMLASAFGLGSFTAKQ
ncbi:ankyrin repeat domain-containing protein [Legionella sp. PATHC035]|uniref:ankyrin repeat domain-containing protein n=1 Tax=Legionella sp. PATHC035 TaxID=2992040 RepID=UPI002244B4EA|nr:ankyrin repeat domain-containing protein [Legionella sp. PATHC035]MCW8409820.1 ankyrin repeat domain-containing protein [Legionella sp. PATHC035]